MAGATRCQELSSWWCCDVQWKRLIRQLSSFHIIPFLFSQSSGLLPSMGKAEMTEKEVPRVGKGGKKNSFWVFILLSSFQHSKSSCVDMFYFHCFAKKSFLQMYLLAPSCLGFLIPASFAHQALVMGFANSLSMSYQGQCKNNVALLCGISCFSWQQ